MANLYSVLPGLTPSSQEIIEAELVAKQILEGKYPDLDLREGTGLRDLVLRPTAYAFALLKKATDYYFAQNTLATVNDSTPSEVVDDLLSNWFLSRSTGTQAIISARLFFARAKNVTLTTDIGFSPDNNLYFFPEASQAYPSDAMSYDAYANEWYLDVSMAAADTGVEYNLSEGSLLYFSTFDPYFLRAEINYLISESSPAETNSQFIQRASSAISTRNLINIPSIESRLLQTFNYLDEVSVVGAGDPDLVRDMIKVYPEDSLSVTPTAASVLGAYVTFTVQNHSFQAGQVLTFSNALPEMYNGSHVVTSTTENSITLYIPENPGYISVLPQISRDFSPVYIHNGGSVDVYCSRRTSTSVLQFTTDANGVATVYGPAYSIVRSAASGGDEADTIPFATPISYTGYTVSNIMQLVNLTTTSSVVTMNSKVSLYDLEQYQNIASISCIGTTVMARLPSGHGIQEGDRIRVDGVTPAAYNGTYTVSYVQGDSVSYSVPVQISGVGTGTMRMYNVDPLSRAYVASAAGVNVVIALPNLWPSYSATVVGQLYIEQQTPYSVSTPYTRKYYDALVIVTGGVATVSMPNHGISAGRRVYLECPDSPTLTGHWKVESTPTGGTFTIEVGSYGVPDSLEMSANVTYIENTKDYGFSARQQLLIDFGNQYANKTASFEVYKFRDVEDVQDYLEAPANRVVCGDYLARGFNLTIIDVEIVSYGLTGFDTLTIQLAVNDYLNSLPAGSTFVLSDLVSALYARGVTNIRTPVGVKYTRYTRDLYSPESGVILDYLDPGDKTNVFLLGAVTSTATPL